MKDKRVTFKLREQDKIKIKMWCAKNNMTISELCLVAINRYINQEEIKNIKQDNNE